MISITLLQEGLLEKVRKHIKKHEGKYLAGAGLTTLGLGLGARRYGKNILKASKPGSDNEKAGKTVKNIGNVAAIGGGGAVLRSGIYSLIKDQITDHKKKNKKKRHSQEVNF